MIPEISNRSSRFESIRSGGRFQRRLPDRISGIICAGWIWAERVGAGNTVDSIFGPDSTGRGSDVKTVGHRRRIDCGLNGSGRSSLSLPR